MAELNERIKQAEEKLKQLRAQKQQAEARKRALESKQLRAEETRRKVLGGALLLEMMKEDDATKAKILKRLDGFLTRPADRTLFGLDAKGEQAQPAATSGPEQKESYGRIFDAPPAPSGGADISAEMMRGERGPDTSLSA